MKDGKTVFRYSFLVFG